MITRHNEPLAKYSSFRTGGKAANIIFPESTEEFVTALRENPGAAVLGNLSNTLVLDGGIDGTVIITTKLNSVSVNGNTVTAAAGASLTSVAVAARDASLAGCEFLYGIPGTVGGGVFMNAGAYGGEIADIIENAVVFTPDGKVTTLSKDDLDLGYRTSKLQSTRYILLSAAFSLQSGNKDAVTELANTIGAIDDKQKEASDTTAAWVTDYDKKIKDFTDGVSKEINGLDKLQGNARTSAINTVNAYANSIIAQRGQAVSAAQSLVDSVKNVFNTSNISYNLPGAESKGINGYASGTLSAEPGVALVGENGPELIQFRGGETVYTADETKRIIGDIDSRPLFMPPSDTALPAAVQTSSENSESVKKLSIDINGTGAVSVKGKADKEEVVAVMMEYLKPVLMNIVAQEAFEEGDDSYEI